MLSKQILLALLATLTVAAASPVAANEHGHHLDLPDDEEGDFETVLFKRDSVLTPRELEEAASAGIDVQEMWRHSIVKRADGNDITFWVHNSFDDTVEDTPEGTTPNVDKRQGGQFFQEVPELYDQCKNTSFENRTNRSSPSAGAAWRIVNWCRGNKGFFRVFNSRNVNLVGARSKSGANAWFQGRRRVSNTYDARVGTKNVGDMTEASINRFASRPGGASQMKRVAARGGTTCRTDRPKGSWANVS